MGPLGSSPIVTNVKSVAKDLSGNVWLGGHEGIQKVTKNPQGDLNIASCLPGFFMELYLDSEKKLWYTRLERDSGNWYIGLVHQDTYREVSFTEAGIETTDLKNIIEYPKGRFYLASSHGIVMFEADVMEGRNSRPFSCH